jgi:hypothetical protein
VQKTFPFPWIWRFGLLGLVMINFWLPMDLLARLLFEIYPSGPFRPSWGIQRVVFGSCSPILGWIIHKDRGDHWSSQSCSCFKVQGEGGKGPSNVSVTFPVTSHDARTAKKTQDHLEQLEKLSPIIYPWCFFRIYLVTHLLFSKIDGIFKARKRRFI